MSDTVDLEKLCILLERRFRVLQDVKKISDEMGDCISRRDGVSTEIENGGSRTGFGRDDTPAREYRSMESGAAGWAGA